MVYQIDAHCRRLPWIREDRTKECFEGFFDWFGLRVRWLRFICRPSPTLGTKYSIRPSAPQPVKTAETSTSAEGNSLATEFMMPPDAASPSNSSLVSPIAARIVATRRRSGPRVAEYGTSRARALDVLLRRTAADPDRTDEAAIGQERRASSDEGDALYARQRLVQPGVGRNGRGELVGGYADERRIRLVLRGLHAGKRRAVHASEREQVAALVEHGHHLGHSQRLAASSTARAPAWVSLRSSAISRPDYEAYLKKVAELAKKVQTGHADDLPASLDTPGRRALYSNLAQDEELAMQVDGAVRAARPDGWRGVGARENVVKHAIYQVVKDDDEVERLFKIIEQHTEY